MRSLPSISSFLRNEFDKFNNSRARMLDTIYHMTLRLLCGGRVRTERKLPLLGSLKKKSPWYIALGSFTTTMFYLHPLKRKRK